MNRNLIILIFFIFSSLNCSNSNKLFNFDEYYNKIEYHTIAKEKGILNNIWVDKLFNYKVNIHKFEEFKEKGVDLKKILANDYKSRALISDVIIEGKIISKKENPNPKVMFHTEFFVAVKNVYKKLNYTLSDTITLKLITGPIGSNRRSVIPGTEKYEVGENVILYLESMERVFKIYEEKAPDKLQRINSNRNNINVFQPLKKYLVKNEYIYDRTNGRIEKKKKAIKEIRSIVTINTSK